MTAKKFTGVDQLFQKPDVRARTTALPVATKDDGLVALLALDKINSARVRALKCSSGLLASIVAGLVAEGCIPEEKLEAIEKALDHVDTHVDEVLQMETLIDSLCRPAIAAMNAAIKSGTVAMPEDADTDDRVLSDVQDYLKGL